MGTAGRAAGGRLTFPPFASELTRKLVRAPAGSVTTAEFLLLPWLRLTAGSQSRMPSISMSRSSMAVGICVWIISTSSVPPAAISAARIRTSVCVLPTWREARMYK